MKSVFVDTCYWIAIARPDDQWAAAAESARRGLGNAVMVTTDEVLAEFLAALCRGGPRLRRAAAKMVEAILDNPNVHVVQQTRDGFMKGLDRYKAREDKEYSLTDCISMNVMEKQGLREVLTSDAHFEQEGFTILMKK